MPAVLVNRENFLSCLEAVQPGLSAKEIVEQSSCFAFQGGEVFSFNDEIACRCPSPLNDSFQGAVQADKLLNILRKLPEEEITISMTDTHLIIKGKGRGFDARREQEITLPVGAVEKPETWKELHKDFCEASSIVQQCTGSDQSRFLSICVH